MDTGPVHTHAIAPGCLARELRGYSDWDSATTSADREDQPLTDLSRTLENNFTAHTPRLLPMLRRMSAPGSEISIGVAGGSVSVGAGLRQPSVDDAPVMLDPSIAALA